MAVHGVALHLDRGDLRWTGPASPPPELLAELRESKAEVVAFLRDKRRARRAIVREAVRLLDAARRGEDLGPEPHPWGVPADATGWPRWLLDQGAWVARFAWPAPPDSAEAGVFADGDPDNLEAELADTSFHAALQDARARCGLRLPEPPQQGNRRTS